MYVDLAEHNHPVIYIDAWESDYSKNPLSVVSAELFQQLSSILSTEDEYLTKVTNSFNEVLRWAKPIMKFAAALQPDSEFNQISNIVEEMPAVPSFKSGNDLLTDGNSLIESVKDAHFRQIQAMRELKQQLQLVASILESVYELKMPVVVLVDELDRCRPNYAIELLEVIKHFFEIDNFVFLCASDTKQLCASIKTIYGNEFDSQAYLKRFFERTMTLPEPKIADYIRARGLQIGTNQNLTFHPCLDDENLMMTLVSETVAFLSTGYSESLTLRDVDQILAKFEAIILHLNETRECHLNVVVLITALVMNQKGESDYSSPKFNGNGSFNISGHHLKNIIEQQIGLSSVVYSTTEYGFGGARTVYNEKEEMLALQGKGPLNPPSEQFKKSYSILLKLFDTKRSQYFLIEKYKKLVELSDSIL